MKQIKLCNNHLYYKKNGKTWKVEYTEKVLESLCHSGYDASSITTLGGRLKVPLYSFQVTSVLHAMNRNWNMLLADDMGVGKTNSAIACMVASASKKTLIVVPANVKYQWERAINTVIKKPPHTYVCTGKTFDGAALLYLHHSPCVIINYQILNDWLDVFMEYKWDLMILDEAHKIKKSKSICTRACKFLREVTKSVICLSGTPLTDRTSDIWNVVHIVDTQVFPSEFAFQQRYCNGVIDERGRASVSANTMDLHQKLVDSGVMLRRTKAEVQKQLPKVTIDVVPLDVNTSTLSGLEAEVMTQYKAISKMQGGAVGRATFQVRTSMEHYLQEAIRLKIPMIINWIEDFLEESDEKLVVSVVHREKCGNILKKHFGARAILIDGGVSSKHKDELITEFINNPDLKLLIGNILSVGTGTDGLQKVCSNVAIVELPWSPAELWQLISRLDRNGQKQPVNAYILAVYNSIDEVLARVLDKKKNILNEVLDGKSSGVSDSLLHLLKGVKI